MKSHFLKRHGLFALFFGITYVVFFYPLLTLASAPLHGDYELQFYPWMHTYAQALKAGWLPLWTPLIQCGFPLFAEGQSAMLYWPNLLLFKFLPFHTAYNLLFLLHYLAGGVFMYLFLRNKKISMPSATAVTLAYTFGSAAAGGFYQVFSLRPLIWFPLALLFIDIFLEKRVLWPLLALAFVQGQAWLAGYPQLAAYACVFEALYFYLRWRQLRPVRSSHFHGLVMLSLAAAVAIGWVQLSATWVFASHSTRTLQEKSFVLWGSMPPWGILSFFMVSAGKVLSSNYYIGIIPLLFIFRKQKGMGVYWVLAAVAMAMALGAYNPLYWGLMKLPGISLLRNPSKFVFFGTFFLLVIAAFSLDHFLKGLSRVKKMPLFIQKCALAGAALFGFFVTLKAALVLAPRLFLGFGDWYVRTFVLGKSFHKHSPQEYFAKVQGIYESLNEQINFQNPYFWYPFVVLFLFVAAGYVFRHSSKKMKYAILLLVAVDVLIYGKLMPDTGFMGNVRTYAEKEVRLSVPKDGRWLDTVRTPDALFPPNRNMVQGVSQIGAYSPLIDAEYSVLVSDFGAIDDSFGRTAFKTESLDKERGLLNFMGVRYISSDEPLSRFRLLEKQDGRYLYINEKAQEPFAWVSGEGTVDLVTERPHEVLLKVISQTPGLLSRNETFDHGWKVSVDGKPAVLERVRGAFQGVRLDAGAHEIRFTYSPPLFGAGLMLQLGVYALLLIGLLRYRNQKV